VGVTLFNEIEKKWEVPRNWSRIRFVLQNSYGEDLDEHAQTVWVTSETECIELSVLIGLPLLFEKINELYDKNRSINGTSFN